MTDKTIDNVRPVGGDYFRLLFLRKSPYKLNHYLSDFDFDDYWCYKSTNNQRLVSYEEFIKFRYGGYIFFKKDLYNREHIDKWIKFMIRFRGVAYLVKPFPPFPPEKIIIKKWKKNQKK